MGFIDNVLVFNIKRFCWHLLKQLRESIRWHDSRERVLWPTLDIRLKYRIITGTGHQSNCGSLRTRFRLTVLEHELQVVHLAWARVATTRREQSPHRSLKLRRRLRDSNVSYRQALLQLWSQLVSSPISYVFIIIHFDCDTFTKTCSLRSQTICCCWNLPKLRQWHSTVASML